MSSKFQIPGYKLMFSSCPRILLPFWLRLISTFLMPLVASIPFYAWASDNSKPGTPIQTSKVNPTPKAIPFSAISQFSSSATDEEIFGAHIFQEPLAPVGQTTEENNRALIEALKSYSNRNHPEDFSSITQFLETYPASPWCASLFLNLGIAYRTTGYFSRAMEAWNQAWDRSKDDPNPKVQVFADRAIAELVAIHSWLGRADSLEKLLVQIEGRNLHGSATEKVSAARQALWIMRNQPGECFKCGPYALSRIQAQKRSDSFIDPKISATQSHPNGLSLSEIQSLASKLGMDYQVARRDPRSEIIVPCVIHWKADHYSALVRKEGDRYLLQDTTFDTTYHSNLWITQGAIDAESSGYFLVPTGELPPGWRTVPKEEAGQIFGKGLVSTADLTQTKVTSVTAQACPINPTGLGSGSSPMAQYVFHALLASLSIFDTPVGHTPPRGPAVQFTVTYNQREATQPSNLDFSNFGRKWNYEWLSFVEDDPSNPSADVNVVLRGGGAEKYTGFSTTNFVSNPQRDSRTILTQTSPISYERTFSNGAKEVFGFAVGVAPNRKVFLTQLVDPAGNTVSLTYDLTTGRLSQITDSIGQITTLFYEHSNPFLITKVTDPFNRSALFSYNTSEQLQEITDVINLKSSFVYGNNDFVNSMTTPYGTTTFEMTESLTPSPFFRTLQATDPQGDKERVDFGIASVPPDPIPGTPAGMITLDGHNYEDRNSSYWDKKAMAEGGGSGVQTKAKIFHWLRDDVQGPLSASGIPYFIKPPLENRLWFNYPGQTSLPATFFSLARLCRFVLEENIFGADKMDYPPV